MVDFLSLLKTTNAYRIFHGDKLADRLSHGYLLVCSDGENAIEYLKLLAMTALCENGDPCTKCRTCSLIEKGIAEDVKVYPQNGESVLKADILNIIEESCFKPIEFGKKIFLINHAETMNGAAQNKLLKTLEEPPENVIIIMSATTDTALLSTVKSRVKKLEIPPFPDQALIDALKEDCPDEEKLKDAVSFGDGTLKRAYDNYHDDALYSAIETVAKTFTGMTSSKKLLEYSQKILSLKRNIKEILEIARTLLRDMLAAKSGENNVINKRAYMLTEGAADFNEGAIIYALNAVSAAEKKLNFNCNEEVVLENFLFTLLEGKYRWQKL